MPGTFGAPMLVTFFANILSELQQAVEEAEAATANGEPKVDAMDISQT